METSDNWISDAARGSLWFSAKLRFEVMSQASGEVSSENRICLFQCQDPELASARAEEIGKYHEHEYQTDLGDRHIWRFVRTTNVMMTFLGTPLDQGIEIYSELLAL